MVVSGASQDALPFPPVKTLVALVALSFAVTACSSDATDADDSVVGDSVVGNDPDATQLSTDEREWCSFAGASEADAERFDRIFDAGLSLGLPMDALNSQAAGLREEYVAEGMSLDEATRRVSEQLLEVETFVAACKEAYADQVGS